MEMRTLNVPKSTPATTLTDVSPLRLVEIVRLSILAENSGVG
jgi:hypothetical protein